VALESLTLYNLGSKDTSIASGDVEAGSSDEEDMWRCADFGVNTGFNKKRLIGTPATAPTAEAVDWLPETNELETGDVNHASERNGVVSSTFSRRQKQECIVYAENCS
jgi:hypothetical protein